MGILTFAMDAVGFHDAMLIVPYLYSHPGMFVWDGFGWNGTILSMVQPSL